VCVHNCRQRVYRRRSIDPFSIRDDLWELKGLPIGLSETTTQPWIEVFLTATSTEGTLNVHHPLDIHQFEELMLSDVQGSRVARPLELIGPNTIRLLELAQGVYLLIFSHGRRSTATARILNVP
jgi:hypothetical protein